MTAEFILEIGTEEIPSGYLDKALEGLREKAEALLKGNRIAFEEPLKTCGTPRRLVILGRSVAVKQDDETMEMTGPPKKAAFDASGKPTKAALGFAKKQGVPVESLEITETPKGEYLFVRRHVPGKPTIEVLSQLLPDLIRDLSWPKSMRWGDVGFLFVRPIHWILALFDGSIVPFELAGVKSGDRTRGHRFHAPDETTVTGIDGFFEAMSRGGVIVDPVERGQAVEEAVQKAAERVSGVPLLEPDLLNTVTHLVESPSAVCGDFDEAFLSLPDPVLITPMKEHQKYFPLYDRDHRLMAHFVAVNNTSAKDDDVVRKGHERVLRARLSDADFFFREDRKRPLLDRLEDLKEVIYQAELGTSHAKAERFTELAVNLSEKVAPDQTEAVRLAARLCKCDLVTEMVMEFPTLQGIMGREYALLDGHPEDVCDAIRDHYLPAKAGDALPESLIGAIVGVADRMDTISGCFAIGQEPTGAADPFALRRHALAILRILEARDWNIPLENLIETSLNLLAGGLSFDQPEVFGKIVRFFRERYKNMVLSSGYESDLVEAVLSAEFSVIGDLRPKIDGLKTFVDSSADFESLVLTFKRVTNILKKETEIRQVDEGRFQETCEKALWDACLDAKEKGGGLISGKRYFDALNLMAGLRKPVDDFFDGVEVLTKKDPALKDNRVALLQSVAHLFLRLADLSKFSI